MSAQANTALLRFQNLHWGQSRQLRLLNPRLIIAVVSREWRLNVELLNYRERLAPRASILFLYPSAQVAHPIPGLRASDHVLIFPCPRKQLLALITPVESAATERPIATATLELIGHRSAALLDGDEFHLTKSEFRLLSALADQIGQLVEFADLAGLVGASRTSKTGNVRTYISQLRAKHPRLRSAIVAVEGYGFRLMNVNIVRSLNAQP